MKNLSVILIVFFFNCSEKGSNNKAILIQKKIEAVSRTPAVQNLINPNGNTVRSRILAPQGFEWLQTKPGTFGHYLQNFPVKKAGTKILKFDGKPIATQNLHAAVLDIDTGTEDLQQCADAIIRLRSEFLKKEGRENEIAFHYTSGHLLKWSDYQNGHRLVVTGNKVSPAIVSAANPEANSFKNYLRNIFLYAGTISMFKETTPVTKNNDLQTGDILITAGSPGHVVYITGIAENSAGKKVYLLAQGFTPAQSIHVLSNPFNQTISPWYELDIDATEIKTARYSFSPVNFRRYN